MNQNQELNNTCILFDPNNEAQQKAIIKYYTDNGYQEISTRTPKAYCIGVWRGFLGYFLQGSMKVIDLPKEYYPTTPIVESEQKDEKLKVGDVLYSLDLKKYVVSKIGNKYFECENIHGRFIIETLKSDSQFRAIILSKNKQQIIDNKEIQSLEDKIRRRFGNYGSTKLSLSQLRDINSIIEHANNKSNY